MSIEVPNHIYLGNVTIGFATQPTADDRIYINNTGTLNVSIEALPLSPNDIIAKNLYFTFSSPSTSSGYRRITEFNMSIPWSGELGEASDDYFYLKIDLRGVANIPSDLIGHITDVKFIATAS